MLWYMVYGVWNVLVYGMVSYGVAQYSIFMVCYGIRYVI